MLDPDDLPSRSELYEPEIVVAGNDSVCAVCSDPIWVGDRVLVGKEGDWAHEECE
jgi:hypothetical protein